MIDRAVPDTAGPASCRLLHRLKGWGILAGLAMVPANVTMAFPIDTSELGPVPQGTELAAPDARGLEHQLQLVNGLAAPIGGGWTMVPRFDYQEMLTDNVLEQHNPRRWDIVSYVSPNITVAGDMPRVTAQMAFQPTLVVYANDGSLNALTEQLNGIATVALAPDLAYIDLRTVAGVQSTYGGLGGLGGIGASTVGSPQSAIAALAGNSAGLTRNNEYQTGSLTISPYLVQRFGDVGIGKLGYSFNVTRSDQLNGFATPPFPVGGNNGQTLLSNEEIARFTTGDFLEQWQDMFDVDLLQNQTRNDAANILFPGVSTETNIYDASRTYVSDRLTYSLTHNLSVFGSVGHEDITYTTRMDGQNRNATPPIHDLTWDLGLTWVPNLDSSLTLSYGHLNGYNSFAAHGYYAVTGRTSINIDYGSTFGTQLEYLQNQLNLAVAGPNGAVLNGRTGGSLFGSTNALPAQTGIFRTDTFSVGFRTILNRDIVTFSLLLTKQNAAGVAGGGSSAAKTFQTTWVHSMRPDMTLNAVVAYSIQSYNPVAGVTPGDSTSIVAGAGWQWQLSDTLSTSLRYSLFERRSAISSFSFYQNMLIFGVSKTF